MIHQPWIQNQHWEQADSKLKQLDELSFRLPHADTILSQLPLASGIFSILGPRQVGKSTLLKLLARKALSRLSPASLAMVEGDALESWRELFSIASTFVDSLPVATFRGCLLIDEITSIDQWHRAIKLLADQGKLDGVLVVYTGSSTTSLRAGGELFPGRRGRHRRTDFELHPASFRHLHERMSFEDYLTIGGFPWAVNEYLRLGIVPDYVGEIYWGWIKGEFFKRGKSEHLLRHALHALSQRVGTGLSHHAFAREMGLASNETARQYVELLMECFAIVEVPWLDPNKGVIAPRKNRKYYPTDPFLFHLFRTAGAFSGLNPKEPPDPEDAGKIAEGIVAHELFRLGSDVNYWAGTREIDFVAPAFLEVKYQSRVTPQEFSWFEKTFPKRELLVLTKNDHFHLGRVRAIPLKEWLLLPDEKRI